MQDQLKTMIEHASSLIETVFNATGEVLPMWEATTEDGKVLLITAPELMDNKDNYAKVLRKMFEDNNVVQYVFITEAWMATNVDEKTEVGRKALEGGSLADYPGRIEVVTFMAEDCSGLLQAHRMINRDGNKPKLEKLEFISNSLKAEGRFVGMLQRKPLQ